ncbi:hypothetical protein H2198_005829 [Neophaeococcomyces mojaviensis]|uniref:Uncharacterized protein n=1 Tax=Neophaeococcomyces mojaviensis TaxID=3383035 RepID=A0ACC3A4U4_9EURO|nr:hypothetical protein H2198_005829 [Knufia sp. JES_112]
MPLPVRTTSVRTNATDLKKPPVRSHQPPKVAVKPKQAIDTKDEKPAEIRTDDQDSSATTLTNPANASQTSSRIPSPFKRNSSSQSTHTQQTRNGQQIPPNRGHVRQRSAIVPPPTPLQRFGHVRSISAISVKTTQTSTNDSRKPVLRPTSSTVRQLSSPTKSKLGANKPVSTAVVAASRAEVVDPHQEILRNELLQLSIVHETSAKTLQAYESNIERSLATHQAEVVSKQAVVLRKKLASSAAINACALAAWLQKDGHQNVCRSIQDLSIAVRDVQDLEQIFASEDGLATAFDEWHRKITNQAGPGMLTELNNDCTTLHSDFQESILPQLQRFKQRIDSTIAFLTNLPSCLPMSSLCSTVRNHISLAESLRSQCEIMLQIGSHLVQKHRKWLEQEVAIAISEHKSSNLSTSRATTTPVWEM